MSQSDLLHLTSSLAVRKGLQSMLEALCPIDCDIAEQWTSAWVEIAPTLFLIEVAKRAEDRPEYFPHGKWATIQAIQERVDLAITSYLSTPEVKGQP